MQNSLLKTSDILYIAAADSSEADKRIADYVCSGTNDQDIIQSAIDTVSNEKCGEIRGVRIILLQGNYYISAFPRKNQYGNVAIMTGPSTNKYGHIAITISGSECTESTVIHLTEECYNSLNNNENYSVFGCYTADWEHTNWNHHLFKSLYVTIPDNQKNIVCFDGRNMGSMGLRRCKCICETRGLWANINPQLPVENFVAFMGTAGSNNMWESKWEFCQAEGFGQGFAVGSEHLYIQKCTAAFGRYGFTFNNYPRSNFGAVVHPITIVSCADEANANLWKFGKNEFKQCIRVHNLSFEVIPEWFALDGHFATEENPGDYVGHIDFVGNNGMYSHNSVNLQFWEKGSGNNFETVNSTHKKVCSSKERREYCANIGQQLFDTDINKLLIYTENGWVDTLGNSVE